MVTKPQTNIDAIIENIDGPRAQRFLDNLRQEGVLPGRRSRFAHRLRGIRHTLVGWGEPLRWTVRFLFRRRRPAAYWVGRMDQLVAQGMSAEYAAQSIAREMASEDTDLAGRWLMWLYVLLGIAVWTTLILAVTGVIG